MVNPMKKNASQRDDLKHAFLMDNTRTFHRIGDVGTPHAIFHLIELLGFLASANPERVFDLVAHALLTAGRKQGYQFNRWVRIALLRLLVASSPTTVKFSKTAAAVASSSPVLTLL